MEFPVTIAGAHPHRVFDLLSLLVATQLFWWQARRANAFTKDEKWTLAAGAVLGGALGAKLLVLLEDPATIPARAGDLAFWLTGKSIVGGLLGGLAGVEIAKKLAGMRASTGDHFVLPLAVGLAIGRVGCFLSGLSDDAFGVPTTLPWSVDFGDGPRHPTQLYEIAFALAFAAATPRLLARREEAGDAFRLFMVAYFSFRFVEEIVRAGPHPYFGASVYQLACLVGLAYYLRSASVRARLARLVGLARAKPPRVAST